MTASPTATERFEKFIESDPWRKRWVALVLGAVFVAIDYLHGPAILPVYFILPVMLMGWNWGARYAVGLAVLMAAAHIWILHQWGAAPAGVIGAVNAALRAGVLAMLAIVTARLGTQTRASRARVQLLEGVLPTCCFCKDIRNDEGEWERIEEYVSHRSVAQFSHGICPPCAEKHYGVKGLGARTDTLDGRNQGKAESAGGAA